MNWCLAGLRLSGLVVVSLLLGCEHSDRASDMADSQIGSGAPPLVTGKLLEDRFAEASQDVGSLPINMISSPDGKYALTTDAGSHEAVWAIRISDGKGTGHVDFGAGGTKLIGRRQLNGLYYGLAVGPDNTVYAAQGHRGSIKILQLNKDGSLTTKGSIAGESSDFPAGLALDDRGLLYVANNDPTGGATSFEAPASVAIFNVKTGQEVGRFKFDNTIAGTSNFPLSVAVLRDGRNVTSPASVMAACTCCKRAIQPSRRCMARSPAVRIRRV
jgi:hypothetical protein